MKRKLFTLILIAFGMTVFGQSSLPNGDFENWYWAVHPTHANGGFWEPSGGFFHSLNILDTIPTPPGLMCFPTDSVHSGDSAVRLVTKKIDVLNILIPGIVGTVKIKWETFNASLGEPYVYTTKPLRFQGYHMAFPVNGDSSAAVLLLSKWNSTNMKRDTIAYNKLVFQGEIPAYSQFDTEITYWDNTTMPDSITVLLLSSAGFDAVNMIACKGEVGSKAYYDDVTITNVNGIPIMLTPDVNVKLFPNPASDFMKILLSKAVKQGAFEIYDAQGKFMTSYPVNSVNTSISVSGLATGTYYFKLTEGKTILNTGTFVVSR